MKGRNLSSGGGRNKQDDEGEDIPEGMEVVYKPLTYRDQKTSSLIPLELTDQNYIPTPDEELNGTIRDVLKSCGWKIDKVLLPKHFMKFLVAAMLHFSDRNALWMRLFGKGIPRSIEHNPAWIDLVSPSGSTRFEPAFWSTFFKETRCHISPKLVQMSRYLALFVDIANMHGINVTVENILPIFILRLLAGRNAAAIVADDSIAKLMFKGSMHEGQAARERMDAFASKLLTVRWTAPVEEENALVMLLCASTFRGAPFLRRCFHDGLIPVIQHISPRHVNECIGSQVCDTVGCQCGPHEGSPSSTMTENEPGLSKTHLLLMESKKKEMEEKIIPAYTAFPCIPVQGNKKTPVEMLSMFSLHMEPLSKRQASIANIVSGYEIVGKIDNEFNQIANVYANMMGFSKTVDAWAIVKSMYVALVGGCWWLDAHKIIVKEHIYDAKNEKNYMLARNELAKLDLDMIVKLIESVDATRVKATPVEFSLEQMILASRLAEPLKRIPYGIDPLSALVQMSLAMHMVSGNSSSYTKTDLWKKLGFTLDNGIQKSIDSLVNETPYLSNIIRALVMASVTTAPIASSGYSKPSMY